MPKNELHPRPLPDHLKIGSRCMPFGGHVVASREKVLFGPLRKYSPLYEVPGYTASFSAVVEERPVSHLVGLRNDHQEADLRILTRDGMLVPFAVSEAKKHYYSLFVHVREEQGKVSTKPNISINGKKYPGSLVYETSWGDQLHTEHIKATHVYSWEPTYIFLALHDQTLKNLSIVFTADSDEPKNEK